MRLQISALSIVAALMWGACGADDGEGTVNVTAYGEAFIEEGIPADEVGDGWSVTFDRFVVTIEDVVVGGVAFENADPVDLALPSDGAGHLLATGSVPAGDHTHASYVVARVELAGRATLDGVEKSFEWVFDNATAYTGCHTTTAVADSGAATFQITIHADHFLYDSIVAEDPQVLFQALADADTDGDGVIAQAELEATDIGAYDPGSEGDVDNLWTWLVALSRTLGHVDGEGHCDAASR